MRSLATKQLQSRETCFFRVFIVCRLDIQNQINNINYLTNVLHQQDFSFNFTHYEPNFLRKRYPGSLTLQNSQGQLIETQQIAQNSAQPFPNFSLRLSNPTAFITTKYLVNEHFADLLGLEEPITRKECQTAFINYSINHDFIDLKNH